MFEADRYDRKFADYAGVIARTLLKNDDDTETTSSIWERLGGRYEV